MTTVRRKASGVMAADIPKKTPSNKSPVAKSAGCLMVGGVLNNLR